MSTIANGVPVQGQVSAKSKSGHAKAATGNVSSGADFASTVASVAGRGGDGGRKGSRISLSMSAETKQPSVTERSQEVRTKAMYREAPALAEALRKAATKSEDMADVTNGKDAASLNAGDRADAALAVDENAIVEKPALATALEGKAAASASGPEGRIFDTNLSIENLSIERPKAADDKVNDGAKQSGVTELHQQAKADPADRRDTQATKTENRADPRTIETKSIDRSLKASSDDAAKASDAADAKSSVGNLLAMLSVSGDAPQATALASLHAGAQAMREDTRAAAGTEGGDDANATIPGLPEDGSGLVGDADGLPDNGATESMPTSDTDQLFRLIRADGKGRDADMTISASGDKTIVRDADPQAVKGEVVTVVDSRRYIGLAQTNNSTAVTTAIAQDPEWATSLNSTGNVLQSHAGATGKVVNTLKIQMHPIELGLVTATLRLQGEELVVSLHVETKEAYRQLSDDQDAIVKALRGQGFAVDQVSVQLSSPSDKGANAQQQQQGDGQSPQQQQQFSSQPQTREGGNGRQGGGEHDGRNFARQDNATDANASDNASGLAGGQPVRSGGVYL